MPKDDAKDDEQRRLADERLSALVDGELDGASMTLACVDWRDDERSRATWHAYHVAADVLRSDDLAADAACDAAFLRALRVRLASEPVVFAPERVDIPAAEAALVRSAAAGLRAGRSPRWTWRSSSAVAAGFVVVAGALVMTRSQDPQGSPEAVASAAPAASLAPPLLPARAPVLRAAAEMTVASSVSEPQPMVANGQLIRDARLDRYLAAHKQFAGTSALGIPSTYLRSATAEAADR